MSLRKSSARGAARHGAGQAVSFLPLAVDEVRVVETGRAFLKAPLPLGPKAHWSQNKGYYGQCLILVKRKKACCSHEGRDSLHGDIRHRLLGS